MHFYNSSTSNASSIPVVTQPPERDFLHDPLVVEEPPSPDITPVPGPVTDHHLTPPRFFLFWILDKPASRARVRLLQIRGSTRHRLFLMIQLCPTPKHLQVAQHIRCNPSKAARVSAVIA
ncbi:unnamed protein product [Ixodes persulcatus]